MDANNTAITGDTEKDILPPKTYLPPGRPGHQQREGDTWKTTDVSTHRGLSCCPKEHKFFPEQPCRVSGLVQISSPRHRFSRATITHQKTSLEFSREPALRGSSESQDSRRPRPERVFRQDRMDHLQPVTKSSRSYLPLTSAVYVTKPGSGLTRHELDTVSTVIGIDRERDGTTEAILHMCLKG